MHKHLEINSLQENRDEKSREKWILLYRKKTIYSLGVFSAISRVFTVLQKAIREQLLSYYIHAFCIVHNLRDGKAVLCRP